MVASTAGALFLVTGFEYAGLNRLDAWMASFAVMAALVLIGIVTVLCAREPEQSRIAEAAAGGKPSVGRVAEAAIGAFSEFLTQRDAIVVLVFVMLFKFTDAFAGAMTVPFIIDIGFTRNDYAIIVKGVGLAATLIGGFAGGFLARGCSLIDLPVDRRPAAGGVQSDLHVAGAGRSAAMGADRRRHGGSVHRRDRHGDLRRLSLRALQEPAAHRHAIRAADRAGVGRPHLSVVGRGLCGAGDGLADVLRGFRGVAVPSLILLAWLQRRGHFDGLGTVKV